METHIDLLGLAGLIVGLLALVVAIYGIRNVREQVKFLVTLERNRLYARVTHKMTRRFLEPIGDDDREASLSDSMNSRCLLAHWTQSRP
jgi:hypothetical protein